MKYLIFSLVLLAGCSDTSEPLTLRSGGNQPITSSQPAPDTVDTFPDDTVAKCQKMLDADYKRIDKMGLAGGRLKGQRDKAYYDRWNWLRNKLHNEGYDAELINACAARIK